MKNSRFHPGPVNRALVEINQAWLSQALALIENLGDSEYRTSPAGFEPHRVGGHLRHILEFYECFLDGLEAGVIDYDARRRDLSVEKNRASAAVRIRELEDRMHREMQARVDAPVSVRMEDAGSAEGCDPLLSSTVNRELQALSSHTIHHFALIAMTLKAHGLDVHPDFGMSPATLRFQAARNRAVGEAA